MVLQIPILQIFVHEKPVLTIGAVAYQGNQVRVIKSAQYIDFYTEFPFSVGFFKWGQLHFLDCYNLSFAKQYQISMLFEFGFSVEKFLFLLEYLSCP